MKCIAIAFGSATALGTALLLAQADTARPVGKQQGHPMKIRIKAGGEVLTATLTDTETSRDFVSLFPLKLAMKDYAGAEKIGYPPRKLSTGQAPAGYDPAVGDIAYYAPWGNVAVFYKDAGYAKGLIKLGTLDGGIEKLAGKKGDFQIEWRPADSNPPAN
jgi:hypothetical protein